MQKTREKESSGHLASQAICKINGDAKKLKGEGSQEKTGNFGAGVEKKQVALSTKGISVRKL